MRCVVAVLLFLSTPLAAQDFPARYDVTGVAADDTLNIRALPDASSEIIGELMPGDKMVEVLRLSADGRWGRIAHFDGNGWVSMRYMSESAVPASAHEIPRPLLCVGTEPFWLMEFGEAAVGFDMPDASFGALDIVSEAAAQRDYLGRYRSAGGAELTIMIDRAICTDGMSDREYGFRANLFIESAAGNLMEPGCCTLDAR